MKAEERPVLRLARLVTYPLLSSPRLSLAMSLRGNGGSPVMIGRAVNDGDVAAAAEEDEGDHSITQKRYQVAEMARPAAATSFLNLERVEREKIKASSL